MDASFAMLMAAFVPLPSKKDARDESIIPGPKATKRAEPIKPLHAPAPATDTTLDSFDKVMEAMDTELAKVTGKRPKRPPVPSPSNAPPPSRGNPLPPLPTEADLEAMDEDDLAAMDRELRAALRGAGIEDEDDEDMGELDVDEAKGLEGEDKREYQMMRDFLESYQSQAGQSGVVGNLFGRLGKGGS